MHLLVDTEDRGLNLAGLAMRICAFRKDELAIDHVAKLAGKAEDAKGFGTLSLPFVVALFSGHFDGREPGGATWCLQATAQNAGQTDASTGRRHKPLPKA